MTRKRTTPPAFFFFLNTWRRIYKVTQDVGRSVQVAEDPVTHSVEGLQGAQVGRHRYRLFLIVDAYAVSQGNYWFS